MTGLATSERVYPFAVSRTDTEYAGAALQFPSFATAATRDELLTLLREQAALYLLDCTLEGHAPEAPANKDDVDLRDYYEEGEDPEVVYIEPAPVSVISVAIERALREEGVSYAELARRMSVPRSVITRITNPFYFGHTTRTLRSVARALGREVRVSLDKPGHGPPPSDVSPPLVIA